MFTTPRKVSWGLIAIMGIMALTATFTAGLIWSGAITWGGVQALFDEASANKSFADQVAAMDDPGVCDLKLTEVRNKFRTESIEVLGSPRALGRRSFIIPRVYTVGTGDNAHQVRCFFVDLRGYNSP